MAQRYRHDPRWLPFRSVAKRSVRKARAREAQGANARRSDAPATPSRAPARGFWLGVLASAAVLVPLAVVAVLVLGGGESEPSQPASAETEPRDAEADGAVSDPEDLRKQFAARDKQQIKDLTTRTRSMVDEFGPVIVGLGKTLPPASKRVGPLAGASEVEDWLVRVREADEYFAETVSGETATNVARSGFGNAVDVLLEAVETYKLALDEPAARDALLAAARDQRDLAARTWSTASIQLDAINVEAGFGHQHVVFPSSAGPGAQPPDTLPEGTDAESSGDR
jgi:hypothetical protein